MVSEHAVAGDPPGIRRFATNALSLVSVGAVIRASNFVIYAMVARQVGAAALGRLALALSLFYVFQILATAGQRMLLVRDGARDRDGIAAQLRTSLAVVSLASLLAYGPLAGLVMIFGWDRDTTLVIAVIFIGLLPSAVDLCFQGVLQGLERMQAIAYASVPLHLLKAAVATFLLLTGSGVVAAAAVIAVTSWLVPIVEYRLMRRLLVVDPGRPTGLARSLTRGSAFLGMGLVFAVNSVIPLLVVSALLGQDSVGVLSAAQQVVVPLALVINSLTTVAFPAMCRIFDRAVDATAYVFINLVDTILSLVLPVVVTVSLFSDQVTDLLYRNDELAPAAELLQLIVWWSVINVVITVIGQTLWATDRERLSLRIGLWTTAVGLVANLIFISWLGVNGFALTLAVVGLVTLVMHYRPLAGQLSPADLARAVWRPTAAAAAQLVAVILLDRVGTAAAIIGGLVVYVATLLALNLVTVGRDGPSEGRISPLAFLSPPEP